MRFHYGPIPKDDDFQPETHGWSGIREPNPIMLNILALPVSMLMVVVELYGISLTWEGGFQSMVQGILEQSGPNPFLVFLVVLVISIPLHELVHLITHPHSGRSKNSILGFWLSRGLFYAHYDGVVSRNRFLSILAAPYLVLAWLPLIILAVINSSVPVVYVEILVMAALTNSVLPAGDAVGFFLMASQVPPSACVKNKGWKSYWKRMKSCGE
jgi:hypothetical protein